MTTFRAIALDLSLTATGVCLPTGETLTIHAADKRGMPRLQWIKGSLSEIMRGMAPHVVVIEGYSYASKGRSAVSLGELGGVVRLWLHNQMLPVTEIPPTCRAKYATGKGNANKDAVLQQAVIRSGRVFAGGNDEADAWWLWQMAMAHYQPDSPLLVKVPAVNRDGLLKVPWVEFERSIT